MSKELILGVTKIGDLLLHNKITESNSDELTNKKINLGDIKHRPDFNKLRPKEANIWQH